MKYWQWGHPDDWTEAEWQCEIDRALRRDRWWGYTKTTALVVVSGIAIYWLGIGW